MAVTRVAVAAALSVAPPSSRRRRVAALPSSSCRPLPTPRASKALHAVAAPAAGAVDEETPGASPPPSGSPPSPPSCSRLFGFRIGAGAAGCSRSRLVGCSLARSAAFDLGAVVGGNSGLLKASGA
jgi:hypothetical protein